MNDYDRMCGDDSEDEHELRDALMRGHESLYASSPIFRANLNALVHMLPPWVAGMAARAQAELGDEYSDYVKTLRQSQEVIRHRTALVDGEFFRFEPRTTREQDEALDRLIGEPKLTWRQRAELNGVAERARQRAKEYMDADPIPPEEFDETMRLYREGWDGDPATLKDYEDKGEI